MFILILFIIIIWCPIFWKIDNFRWGNLKFNKNKQQGDGKLMKGVKLMESIWFDLTPSMMVSRGFIVDGQWAFCINFFGVVFPHIFDKESWKKGQRKRMDFVYCKQKVTECFNHSFVSKVVYLLIW